MPRRYRRSNRPATARPYRRVSTASRGRRSLASRFRPTSNRLMSHVRAAINYGKEIKYVAKQDDPIALTLGISTAASSGNLHQLIPNVTQGIAEHQRIGDRLSPTRAQCHFTFWMRQSFEATAPPVDVEIILMCLNVKGASNFTAISTMPAGTLLRTGNGNSNDPSGSATNILQVNNVQPVNPDNWTLLRKYRLRLVKNSGRANWDSTSPPVTDVTQVVPNISSSHAIVKRTFRWKPPTLKYSNATTDLPTNHYPIWVAWATTCDDSPLPVDSTGSLVMVGTRYEMYFRDA